jgi:membrane-associated phospholipid phosphatase
MKFGTLLLMALLIEIQVDAQTDTGSKELPVYNVNVKYEMPAAITGLILFSSVANPAVVKNASISEEDLKNLSPRNVNSFDRSVIKHDAKGYAHAISRSDFLLNASILSPALLALDGNIRKDWLDILSMYMLTHAVNNTVFVATVGLVHRARPLVYNTGLPIKERIGENRTNSFYSGHVSNTAASTFFIVKVFTDYHQIKGWKRIMLYGVAAIPPALVGHYRIQGGRHFRTDVITGLIVGATSGIVVPELHRYKKKKKMSVTPYYSSSATGISISLNI